MLIYFVALKHKQRINIEMLTVDSHLSLKLEGGGVRT